MNKDQKGMPSGLNKSEGTGVPQDMKDKDLARDKELTQNYTDKDTQVSDNVLRNNPNRNVDKTNTDTASYTSDND
ncbi:MAG: hypothetical protein ABIT96_12180 [Ferruginibacter sp.]